MKHKKLVIAVGGELTTSRISHLRKILKIVGQIFDKIIVIHEGREPLHAEGLKINVICTGMSNMEAKFPLPLRVVRFTAQELTKFKIILRCAKEGDFILFLGIYQPISLLCAKIKKCRTLIFGGGFDVTRPDTPIELFNIFYLYFKWSLQIGLLRCFDRIILESQLVRDFYNLADFDKKILCAHLFIDDIFVPVNPLSERDIDVAFMGVLSKEKGILEFLEACIMLKNSKIIRKVGIWGDGILRDEVRHRIERNDLSNFVVFRKFVNQEDVPKLLNRIKLIVIPSYSEGVPNGLIEAMGCGTAVLATPVGGIPDVIENNETGFLLESNDPSHIASKIIELLTEPELLERVSKNAYNYVRENFSYEKTLEDWRKILSELELGEGKKEGFSALDRHPMSLAFTAARSTGCFQMA